MKTKRTLAMILLTVGLWSSLSVFLPQQARAEEEFNDNKVFPGWNQTMNSMGKKIVGMNGGDRTAMAEEDERRGAVMLIPKVVEILMALVAPLVVVMSIWAGILFVTAGGDEESISKAKRFFMYAVIGFVFIVISFTLVKIGANILKAG